MNQPVNTILPLLLIPGEHLKSDNDHFLPELQFVLIDPVIW